MSAREDAFFFECEDASLLGITHVPARPATLGVLIVVGGPQYRVGSHRQFVLLARALAQAGFAAMRFDYRGMGDSTGTPRDFESVESDLRCAIDAFYRRLPGLQGVVLWGLCDGASAAACYAGSDERVRALVLANPWVRTEETHSRALLEHYYRGRLGSPEFWQKMIRGQLDWKGALRGFARALWRAKPRPATSGTALAARMARGVARRGCPVLMVLSGNDLVAAECRAVLKTSPAWRGLLAARKLRIETREDADHTFSCAAWREEVSELTRAWMLDVSRALSH